MSVSVLRTISIFIICILSILLAFVARPYMPNYDKNLLSGDLEVDFKVIDNIFCLKPKIEKEANSKIGFIIFTQSKVSKESYVYLAKYLAKFGFNSFIVSVPFQISNLAKSQFSKIKKLFPNIETWVLAGHMLASYVASDIAKDYSDSISGLVLMGQLPSLSLNLSSLTMTCLLLYTYEDSKEDESILAKLEAFLPKSLKLLRIDEKSNAVFADYPIENYGNLSKESKEKILEANLSFLNEILKNMYSRF